MAQQDPRHSSGQDYSKGPVDFSIQLLEKIIDKVHVNRLLAFSTLEKMALISSPENVLFSLAHEI